MTSIKDKELKELIEKGCPKCKSKQLIYKKLGSDWFSAYCLNCDWEWKDNEQK